MDESYHIYSKVLVKAKTGSFIMRILLDICLVIYLLACAVLVRAAAISGGLCSGIYSEPARDHSL